MAGRWDGFVADEQGAKALHEHGNDDHRVRVEHDRDTVFVHLSDEDGRGWTTLAVDRASRGFAVGQARSQKAAASRAWQLLTETSD